MEATYRTANGRLTFRVSGEDVKGVFSQIAELQEIFESDTECGCCHSTELHYSARVVEDYRFYELECVACGAQMQFGQRKKGGGLFPKRRDDDGKPMANRGWFKFQPKSESEPVPPVAKPAAGPVPPPRGNGKATVEKRNGVALFRDWDAAQASKQWGEKYLVVADVLYGLKDGNYVAIKQVPKEA
jgi:hypothetical protein